MGKCVQSGSGSYKLTCSNATDSNGYFTRNTTFYPDSSICEGESDPDLLKVDLINSECEKALKVKFSCEFNPIIEDWPGVGVWKSHDDAKLQAAAEECSQVYGPDQVYAFPGTCMNYTNPTTNQKQSWIYTDTTIDGDPSQFLLYYKYLDTLNCEANAEGTNVFPTQVGPLGVCDIFEEGSIIRRQIQSTVSTIPGIVVLPYSSSVSMGDQTKGRGMIIGVVFIILVIYAIFALMAYGLWYYLWVYIPQKKTNELMRVSSAKEETTTGSDTGVQLDAWNS